MPSLRTLGTVAGKTSAQVPQLPTSVKTVAGDIVGGYGRNIFPAPPMQRPVRKGFIIDREAGPSPYFPRIEKWEFQYNPSSYSESHDLSYAITAIPGKKLPVVQYISGPHRTWSLRLLLDQTEEHAASNMEGRALALLPSALQKPLRTLTTLATLNNRTGTETGVADLSILETQIEYLESMVEPDPNLGRPHIIEAFYGKNSIRGVITGFEKEFVLHDPELRPLRAFVDLSITETRVA